MQKSHDLDVAVQVDTVVEKVACVLPRTADVVGQNPIPHAETRPSEVWVLGDGHNGFIDESGVLASLLGAPFVAGVEQYLG